MVSGMDKSKRYLTRESSAHVPSAIAPHRPSSGRRSRERCELCKCLACNVVLRHFRQELFSGMAEIGFQSKKGKAFNLCTTAVLTF